MTAYSGLYYSENEVFKETSLFNASCFDSGVILYEVLRVYKETCLFLEDHVQRLQESVSLSGYSYTVSISVIHHIIKGLIGINKFSSGNVKIVLYFKTGNQPVLYTYFIPHLYPTPAQYKHGVESDLFKAVRLNPNVKRLQPDIRQRVSDFIRAENLYDALLVDDDGTVTEGSKTNVFFIQRELIYTSPGDKVLKGITRGKLIYLCSKLNFKLIEQPIYINSLHEFEAAFFTGTSPKVLPIKRIGNLEFQISNPATNALIKAYDNLIASYINVSLIIR
jgi:branched-chain amino acid aminotransferase